MKNSKEDKNEKATAPLVERGPDGVAINVVSQARLDTVSYTHLTLPTIA